MSDAKGDPGQWDELLAGHVLDDLSDDERPALEAASLSEEDRQSILDLEKTVARVQLAFEHSVEPMPSHLRDRIASDAANYISPKISDAGSEIVLADSVASVGANQRPSPVAKREVFAWLAFAAAMLLAMGFWNARTNPPAMLSLAELRSDLISQATDVIKVDWSAGKHPFANAVQGDVVWSNERQAGYMRFKQMPINEPTKQQYQLWIIDPERDDEPIDGGVFDVSQDGEVIVPIDAKLRVLKPAAFAITIEKPGGVVVSTQESLPLLASVN